MKFYKAILIDCPDPLRSAYGEKLADQLTLDERLPERKCEECGGDEWYLLPKESVAVREGGKPYIECLKCGYTTHL